MRPISTRRRFPASSGGPQGSWVRQFTFCRFENRYIRDISISLVTKDFFQKQNVLEYFLCRCFLVTPSHRNLLIDQKQMRSSVTDERRGGNFRSIIQQPPLTIPLSFEQTICPPLKSLLF